MRVWLTTEQAIALLPDRDRVHTFMNPRAGLMLGADWDKKRVLDAIRRHKCELGGEVCQRNNHGLVIWLSDAKPLFVECQKGTDYQALESAGETHEGDER